MWRLISLAITTSLLAFSSAPALACAVRPPPPTLQERLVAQREWRNNAYAIALARVVLAEGRDGVFEAVVALSGRPPRFLGFENPGNADCGEAYQPELGNLAVLYFHGEGRPVVLPLTKVVDPQIAPLLRAAASRARRGEDYRQAPDVP